MVNSGGKLNNGLSDMFAKHGRLKPGEGSSPSSSAKVRVLTYQDIDQMKIFMDEVRGFDVPEDYLDYIMSRRENHIRLVAMLDDKIVGMALLVIINGAKSIIGSVWDVFVLPEYRLQGIGKSIMDAIGIKAKDLGCEYLTLDCTVDKIEFYEKLGFENTRYSMRKIL